MLNHSYTYYVELKYFRNDMHMHMHDEMHAVHLRCPKGFQSIAQIVHRLLRERHADPVTRCDKSMKLVLLILKYVGD